MYASWLCLIAFNLRFIITIIISALGCPVLDKDLPHGRGPKQPIHGNLNESRLTINSLTYLYDVGIIVRDFRYNQVFVRKQHWCKLFCYTLHCHSSYPRIPNFKSFWSAVPQHYQDLTEAKCIPIIFCLFVYYLAVISSQIHVKIFITSFRKWCQPIDKSRLQRPRLPKDIRRCSGHRWQ